MAVNIFDVSTDDLAPPGTDAGKARRRAFIREIYEIWGDVRYLYVPTLADGASVTEASRNARTLTVNGTPALTALGSGVLTTFDASNDYITMPDAANLSFGDSANDQPFSGFCLANPTNSAVWRWILSKKDDTTATPLREFGFGIDTNDLLNLELWDESADAIISRRFGTALTFATEQVLGFSYDGSRAASGIRLVRNAIQVDNGNGTTTGTYTAMENSATLPYIGGNIGTGGTADSLFNGQLGVVCIAAKFGTLDDHWATKEAINAFYGLSL